MSQTQKLTVTDRLVIDQLAKPTFRSRYAHTPNTVKDRWTQSKTQSSDKTY